MPVEFLSDAEAAAYGRFDGSPSREELDRVFFLDDADRELIDKRRGAPNQLGFALQLTTVRWLGTFLPDPTDVPPVVLAYVGRQLEIQDPSCVARYLERRRTRFEHAEEIKASEALRDFAAVAGEFEEWIAARAYMTGDGPRAIFADATGWLRGQQVLLPGVTTLARLVARARSNGDRRLWETLAAVPTGPGHVALDALLEVAEGARTSELERARRAPADPTGTNLKLALHRVRDIHGVGVDGERARALVPVRRLAELARYGLQAKAPRLVYGQQATADGTVDRNSYVFCVLTQFHRHLKRRDVYAPRSSRWRDPRAQLLSGEAWENAKGPVLRALGLPEDPTKLIDRHARTLDEAYREVASRIDAGTEVTVDDEGKLHLLALQAIPDPASLIALRKLIRTMLPRVSLPEVIVEVMSWLPGFVGAFKSVSGGRTRLEDLHVSIAACLAAHAMNIDFADVVKRGVPALERGRLSHVNQNYLSAETYVVANPYLVEHQAGIPYARALGGGMVAGIDGMRFVVPIPSIYARPNRKYFGPDRGVTYLNMITDQAVGLAGKIVSGAPRDSLHALDVAFSLDHGQRPDILISDSGAYSDLMFGLCNPLGIEYRPELADMPDQRAWRADRHADYGPLNTLARGRLDLPKIRRHWPDILRVIASIYTGTVRAYDVTRVLQRDGNPTPLGEAIQHYGRIHKSVHILQLIDDESYRREVKWIRNLQEGRHALARKVFHGSKGELYQRYREGMEDQLGALGLVLNCIVLWNTVYINAALEQLRVAGYPVLDEDVVRLHPFMRRHLGVQGDYSFLLPALDGRLRELRDPTEGQDEDEDEDEQED